MNYSYKHDESGVGNTSAFQQEYLNQNFTEIDLWRGDKEKEKEKEKEREREKKLGISRLATSLMMRKRHNSNHSAVNPEYF